MAQIIPSISVNNPEVYRQIIESYNAFTKRAQIVVSDGTNALPTIPLSSIWWPRQWTVDIYLRAMQPSQYVPLLLKLKPTLVILDAHSNENLISVLTQLSQSGIKTGIALARASLPDKFHTLIEQSEHVLITAGDPMHESAEASLLQIEKVPLIRRLKNNVEIGWLGGVNASNIRAIAHAGIDIVNLDYILKNAQDRITTFKSLTVEAEQKGVLLQ